MHGAPFDFCWGRKLKIAPDYFWFLVNIFHSVPAMWRSLDLNVSSDRSWEGCMLTCLSHNLLQHGIGRSCKDDPFRISKCRTVTSLVEGQFIQLFFCYS